jgi:mono/diheme cytochrome c family protein
MADETNKETGDETPTGTADEQSHETLHAYSGGQVMERTDVKINPALWVFWGATIVIIIATLFITGAIPGMRIGGTPYAMPVYKETAGLMAVQADMQGTMSDTALLSAKYIDLNQLPRPNGQNLTQAIAAGSDVYQAYCIGCHGPNQDGAGANSTSLDPKPRNLRDADFMQAMSYQRIWTSVHKGVPGTAMPRWENTISDDQIRDAICYVFSLTAPTDASGNFIPISPKDIAGATKNGH